MGRIFEIKNGQTTTRYNTDTDNFGLSYSRDGATGNYNLTVQKANGSDDSFTFTDKKRMMTEYYKAQHELLILHDEIYEEYPVKIEDTPKSR